MEEKPFTEAKFQKFVIYKNSCRAIVIIERTIMAESVWKLFHLLFQSRSGEGRLIVEAKISGGAGRICKVRFSSNGRFPSKGGGRSWDPVYEAR